ncbi:ABC Transporter [Blumeria hordei DH14]|uniref:ABC Transporter n=1 Tax=Blumeria graminis f. sp. hordei (strain DH14) TaxID=546991 RepID=N1J7W6_BLUG1|nr:ABC Transporter [Blumeria hordei DH14]
MMLMVSPAAAWAIIVLTCAFRKNTAAPLDLLFILIIMTVTLSILLIDGELYKSGVFMCLPTLFAAGAVVNILVTPMRESSLSAQGISPPFSKPTAELRSPEDNITVWQFMSVSWISPLLYLGNKRQLNDEDVWSLGYEFKHRIIFEKFRDMKGSILQRLLAANWSDLCIITGLGLIELCANLLSPLLLQKILQNFENPLTPTRATIVYASMMLLIRLISSQSSVFNLWFGRRAYERSRGELITVLYEKTLNRKVTYKSSAGVNQAPVSEGISLSHGKFLASKYPDEKVASAGKVISLMRFDAYEVAQRFWEFSSITTQPFSLIFSTFLIWRLLGWSCLVGILTILIAQAINSRIARTLIYWERERKSSIDIKLTLINQFVDAIKYLRYCGWQDVWLDRIMEARQHELRLRVITSLWKLSISFTNSFASGLFPVVAFSAYTILTKNPLRIDIAFPALQLFSMLENNLRDLPTLITSLLNARISLKRLDDFFSEPDVAKPETTYNSEILLRNASFSWPGVNQPVLHEISASFKPGLTVIYGEVGAGKSTMLQALLGELDLVSGEYYPTSEIIGYCGQTPWLQSMSIRENILFSSTYENDRYNEVIEVCDLAPDLSTFQHGDLSMVGENGTGLSGGQKARVSLARAIYSRANILILDDPISALDPQTANTVVQKCLGGRILEGRTVILVTHRPEICSGLAKQIIYMSKGRAFVLDPDKSPCAQKGPSQISRPVCDDEVGHSNDPIAPNNAPQSFMDDEFRAHGGVPTKVYWQYIRAGKLKWWIIHIGVVALFRLIGIGKTWFLKEWGEAYENPIEISSGSLFRRFPSPSTDIRPWLVGFFLLAVAQSTAYLVSQGFTLIIIYNAGKTLFEMVMGKVAHATFRFYDVTPVGRLMNRLTSDINTVDGNISNQFHDVVILSITWLSSLMVVASVTPTFLFFAIGLSIAFIVIFLQFLPTSQSLRRLEMVSLTPLISNFGAVTDGLTTIRAYGSSYRFQDRVIAVTDTFQKMDHFYWSLQAWLMYRFDILSDLSTFVLIILALYTGLSAGLTAFVLTASSKFVTATHSLCRKYGQIQIDFVSVERVIELLSIAQEPCGKVTPPAYWPRYGAEIVFDNVSIRYAPHCELALSEVSLRIEGGSVTAITGRTGSGKSTLALSLLASVRATSGRILIDGIDITSVDPQCLRSRLTFISQEPVLFAGTMQENLDPLDQYPVTECLAVLAAIADSRGAWNLQTRVEASGRNLSQGQRQLVGLARALLRRSSIIILDEATASVDSETAARVLALLREWLSESTIITIAHRAEAVKNADAVVSLEKGRILEVKNEAIT